MKVLKKSLIVFVLAIVMALAFTGCSSQNSVCVSSIQKTGSDGLTDTYTIFYTDGSTSTFEITNGADGKDGKNGTDGKDGKDGENGKNITADELYEKYKDIYGDISYSDFLSLYMTFENDESNAIANCLQSSAKVYSEFTERDYGWGGYVYENKTLYTGSAVIYKITDEYTYLVTNYHVIYNSKSSNKISQTINCYLYGSESKPTEKSSSGTKEFEYGKNAIPCDYIAGSVEYDLAVLKAKTSRIKEINENACAVELAEEYHVGQTAIAIGNPQNAGISVTKGIVSVDNEYIKLNIDGTERQYRSLRIDTPLYHGNSGGGLFNAHGQLIGITNAGNESEQNINYAIPLSIVKGVVENILYYDSDDDASTNGVYKTLLGVTVTTENTRYVYDSKTGKTQIVEDIIVSDVTKGSVAEQLGVQVGDKLLEIVVGNTRISLNRSFDISDALLSAVTNSDVSLSFERNGEVMQTEHYKLQSTNLKKVA